jgi:hypothetical protein
MILGLNTEKRRFLRDVQDVQKFALIRTGVMFKGPAAFTRRETGADGIDGHYWEHMTDWFEGQQVSSAFKNASLKVLKVLPSGAGSQVGALM